MKRTPIGIISSVVLAGMLYATGAGIAQDQDQHGRDPLAEHLVAPALIMSQAEAIGLSQDQREKVMSVVTNAQREIARSDAALKSEYEGLAAELAESTIDEAGALETLDRVLDLERLVKRHHLQMLVGANNLLQPEQRTMLQSMQRRRDLSREPADVIEKRLRGKVEQLKEIAEGLAAEGKSADHIRDMMEIFTGHMEKGEIDQAEAEALLDSTLKDLRGEGEDGKGAAIDPEALKDEIASMRVEDVAWRRIPWTTCLLDGIKASREQNKPLILWVFIDRPSDDKRC